MNKSFNGAFCAGIFSLGLAASAGAVPFPSSSGIGLLQEENGVFFEQHTTENSLSHVFASPQGNDIQVSGNLASGQVGSRATTAANFTYANSAIILFDTLNFSTANNAPVEINYQINYDGTLAVNSLGIASALNFATIYDITGLSTWLELESVLPGVIPATLEANDSAIEVNSVGIRFGVSDTDRSTPFSDEFIIDASGNPFSFDLTKSGSFIADPARDYAISIVASTNVAGHASADFLNTSTFNFTNLNGVSFTSGSGVFLGNTVSEPSMLALLGIGLLGFMRRAGGHKR